MRLLFAIVSILCILPEFTCAASIRVLSGEHRDFTRFVLHLPSSMEWSFSQNENGAYVTFPDQKPTFDLSEAFERIQKDRVESLVADPGHICAGSIISLQNRKIIAFHFRQHRISLYI